MYEIDELANIVPMANEFEQFALTEDIRENGQRESAVLWRGRLVDGRCRQLSCVALGVDLEVRKLDDAIERDEVALIVKSLNTRRNLTDTQKCMSAFLQQSDTQESNESVARKWGISLGTYKNARYVGVNRPELVGPLFHGKSVEILDPDKGYRVTSNKVNTIARIIKKTVEDGVVTVDDSEVVRWKADGLIKTEQGKEWFYATVRSRGEVVVNNPGVLADYIELANLKFKAS